MTLEKLVEAFEHLMAQLARQLLEMFLVVFVAGVAGLAMVSAGDFLSLPTRLHTVLIGAPVVLGMLFIIWRVATFNMYSTNQCFADLENVDK